MGWRQFAWNVSLLSGKNNKNITYFFQKTDFDIPCKLSPVETIFMECQNLFSGENKKKYYQFVIRFEFAQWSGKG